MASSHHTALSDRQSRVAGFVVAVLALLPAVAGAGQPGPNPSVQVLRPGQVGKVQSHVPGSPHTHVLQPGEYGKSYRYGHSVNGAMGDIIIWSPRAGSTYGMQERPRMGVKQPVRLHPPTGPRLQYKPDYGDPPLRRRD